MLKLRLPTGSSDVGPSGGLFAAKVEAAVAHTDLCGFPAAPAANPGAHLLCPIHWVFNQI